VPPGMDRGYKPFPWFSVLGVLFTIILIGGLFWLFGQATRNGMPAWFAISIGHANPTMQILDARPNRVLMLETSGSYRRILVKDGSQSSWLLVSLDDYSATTGALSPDGTTVAYRSGLDNGQIVVVNLESNQRNSMGISMLQPVGPNLLLCDWTPISWSPDSARVAFYVCQTQLKQSMLMWMPATVNQPKVVTGTEVISLEPRQVQWLNDSQVVVTVPPATLTGGSQVTTHDVK
jgi:hypothetical protein